MKVLNNFLRKEGGFVFTGALYTKLISFFISLLLVRVLTQDEFGELSFILSFLTFFIPFSGGGLYYSYLRYAPNIASVKQRQLLFSHSRSLGFIINIVLAIIILVLNHIFDFNQNNSYLNIIIFYIFGYFSVEMIKANLRVQNKNKRYALVDALSISLVLVFGVILSYYFGLVAYIIVFTVSPIIITILYRPKAKMFFKILSGDYLKYGLWVGLGAIASQLMYSLDIFLIGQIVKDSTLIAIYKTATILPLALFFIPNSYITTYYTQIASNDTNKSFLVNFTKSYFKWFSIVSLILACVLIILSEAIIVVFFGEAYEAASELFRILVLGMVGAFILRIPYGNVLAAVGKSSWNAVVALIMLILNGILNYWAISKWGIQGAAFVTSILLWLSGLVSALLFKYYISQLPSTNS